MRDTNFGMKTFLYLHKPLDDALFQILQMHMEIKKIKIRLEHFVHRGTI